MILLIYIFILSLIVWIILALRPDRFYWYNQVFSSVKYQSNPSNDINTSPKISVVIPCRNEEEALPHTLPSILSQNYHNFEVILVNDQSTDQTQAIAEEIQSSGKYPGHLHILYGENLPQGWAGKMWALKQGIQKANGEWILLTDADLVYSQPTMLKSLIDYAMKKSRDMVSLMAKLRAYTFFEKLLIPAFLYFFKMLYPFSQVPQTKSKVAAAAGGCILIRRSTLESIGGIEVIRHALIDDIALARAVKNKGFTLELMDGPDLLSYRGYDSLSGLWKMVTRSAFTELKYSYWRLLGCTLGLGLVFIIPILSLLSFIWMPYFSTNCYNEFYSYITPNFLLSCSFPYLGTILGGITWCIIVLTYFPTIHYYKLFWGFSLTLPFAGVLYLAMTWDSARQYLLGTRAKWKERSYSK